jgi:hypothetical protein
MMGSNICHDLRARVNFCVQLLLQFPDGLSFNHELAHLDRYGVFLRCAYILPEILFHDCNTVWKPLREPPLSSAR